MKLRIDDAVWLDLKKAIDYYEETTGKGEHFYDDYNATLDRIENNPYLYQIINKRQHRQGLLTGYKYSIFYKVEEDEQSVDVFALAGQRQKPDWMD